MPTAELVGRLEVKRNVRYLAITCPLCCPSEVYRCVLMLFGRLPKVHLTESPPCMSVRLVIVSLLSRLL